jgi:choline dehydrogenase-like flavoprotein
MPFLDVGLHFTKRDAASVVRSHELLDAALRGCGVGRLEFHQSTRAERLEVVLAQATDGFHQTGATRMAREPSQGVVDADCKVHGIENLWIAGSSVLPTSGQANPTFIAVALGIRLARTLKAKLGSAKGSNVGPITEINLPASKASAGGTIERS